VQNAVISVVIPFENIVVENYFNTTNPKQATKKVTPQFCGTLNVVVVYFCLSK
jgi:hypothetical protein